MNDPTIISNLGSLDNKKNAHFKHNHTLSNNSNSITNSNSDSKFDSPRLSDGYISTPTSIDEMNVNLKKMKETTEKRNNNLVTKDKDNDHDHSNSNSLYHTDSYICDLNDDNVLLNKNVKRLSLSSRRNNSITSSNNILPFHSTKHSQIIPFEDSNKATNLKLKHNQILLGQNSSDLLAQSVGNEVVNDGQLKSSETATKEIQKMKQSLLNKRELKRKRKNFLMDDDRVLIGNKVSEGHVNFIIAYNMLTGIRVAVSRCSGIMKPLTPMDFKFNKKLAFDYHGNELTPSSQYAFKFKDYCPEVFRELRALFGLDPADYLVSLTSKYILSELNSPGKSGSFFYYSRDYKYIIKTIHHSEHIHLRKHLEEYYHHIKQNPDSLICQFYGLHRVKMPISFENKIKHRKIYFLVMNNLFPPDLKMNITYDLKGSTWGRFTKVDDKKLSDDVTYRPVLKDLNWLDSNERIKFGPLKKKKFLEQLKKDVDLLAKLNIMDYSLLLGIHDMDKVDSDDGEDEANEDYYQYHNHQLNGLDSNSIEHYVPNVITSNVIPHYFKQYRGGIKSSDQFNKDENLIYYVGIIDCLTNYSILKKLETFWRSLSHDRKIVSAIPPKDYANRFYEFIEDSVDALPKKKYKDNPEATEYHDK